jgi:citrate synthase
MTSQSKNTDVGTWRTAIASSEDDRIIVRGHDLEELIGRLSFSEMMFLVLTGNEANAAQARMLDALMVSVMDHGISPSSTVTRFVAASGVPIQVAVAAGVMTFGDIHGGAGQETAKLLQENVTAAHESGVPLDKAAADLVQSHRATKRPLPGFGHPQHPDGDPRVRPLRAVAEETGVAGEHLMFMDEIQRALAAATGRQIRMNIDGVMGGVLSDLGLDWRYARTLMFVPRAVGLSAHATEELDREGGWRQIPMSAVTYDGPPVRGIADESS